MRDGDECECGDGGGDEDDASTHPHPIVCVDKYQSFSPIPHTRVPLCTPSSSPTPLCCSLALLLLVCVNNTPSSHTLKLFMHENTLQSNVIAPQFGFIPRDRSRVPIPYSTNTHSKECPLTKKERYLQQQQEALDKSVAWSFADKSCLWY